LGYTLLKPVFNQFKTDLELAVALRPTKDFPVLQDGYYLGYFWQKCGCFLPTFLAALILKKILAYF
jgi:hypothetical protein